ncbi:MAG: nucleotide sugar dehydrogenase [Candidatus Aenigmatarchaeota archaeon]
MIFSVFGLGNIGISLVCIFASIGKVIGADLDEKKVRMINEGISPLSNEVKVPKLLKKYVKQRKIKATNDLNYAARNSDVKVIIVPLILKENKPDFSNIKSVSKIIGKNLKKEDLVIVSTTMPLGATRNFIGKILEKESKMKMGRDFYLVYAPERAMIPHVIEDLTEKWHQIIGGVNRKSAEVAKSIYKKINKKGVILVENCETAEMIKLLEGIYRYVNIALANEIALLCEKFKIDFIEVMKNFNLIPYYNLHKATIGVGGHCIPIYPNFVLEHLNNPNLISLSIEINKNMPKHSVEIIEKNFGPLKNKKIAVLGLSYKGNVKEDRFSPTYDVLEILKKRGAEVYINDPFYSKKELEEKTKAKFIELKNLNFMDGVIVATDHDEFKRINFKGNVKFVFDGKSFLNPKKIIKKGIKYLAIGRNCF